MATDSEGELAVEKVLDSLRAEMDGVSVDLACVFVSHHYGDALLDLGPRLARELGARVLVGSSGESVIGGSREVEEGPALSVWAAHLPGTEVRAFEATLELQPDGTGHFLGAPDIRDASRASVLLFADPYSFAADEYLASLDRQFPGVAVVGGMASGGQGPGQNLLITERGLMSAGAVGVVLEGDVEVGSVVSQGCRPVGKPWVVTACEKNVLRTLASRPAVDVLFETVAQLSETDRELFQHQPFVGLAIDAAKSTFERGDFLVRGIVGIEPKNKSFAVGDTLRRGQTVQFLVRDARSASEDLAQMVRAHSSLARAREAAANSVGALLFTCNGRGKNMFSKPDHDITCVRSELAHDLPIAGFFANGEFGPVGRRNFLHGFTASLAIFRMRGD
ncbi:MAG TPA: FIST N-terminal domain-containing protein [Planctomycetota bacterium]|nr:FIST N-terminal domain-containing protein [Planctomycetota bacterium]